MNRTRLTIELVPSGQWYVNLRSLLSKEDWDYLRRRTYKKAGYRCEICGGKGPRHPVECHEIWRYEDDLSGKKGVQVLDGLIALCPKCHQVKHFGFAQVRGKGREALKHLCTVNGWSQSDGLYYVEAVFEQWHQRSTRTWKQDLSWIESVLSERDS